MKIFDVKTAFIALLILVAIHFYSLTTISDWFIDYLGLTVLILIIVLSIYYLKKKSSKRMIFSKYIKAIIIFTLLSSIPAYLFHKQSIPISLLASRTIFFWLVYFLLHKMRVNVFKIEKLLVLFGTIWAFLMVIQQFTYPVVWFSLITNIDADNIATNAMQRGGLIRIFVQGTAFGYFLIFYSWRKLIDKITIKSFLIFSLALLSLFLVGSRQIILALVVIFLFDLIISVRFTSKKGTKFLIILIAIAAFISTYAVNYIIALITLSQEQNVISENYIRSQEVNFFLFKYWPHWLCYFFGNGWEHSLSSYGVQMINHVNNSLGYFRGDIGLIGAFNKFGAFFVLVALLIFYKIIIPSKNLFIPHHIRLFYIFCFLTSFSGGDYFEVTETIIAFSCTFYIIDRNNANNYNFNSNSQQAIINTRRS